jgi:hypothetical protein
MDEEITAKEAEEIKKILEKNLQLTEEIYKKTKYIKRYVIISQIMGFIKILLILIPIVLGIIYLPPLLKDVYSQYKNLLDIGEKADTININNLPSEVQKFLK